MVQRQSRVETSASSRENKRDRKSSLRELWRMEWNKQTSSIARIQMESGMSPNGLGARLCCLVYAVNDWLTAPKVPQSGICQDYVHDYFMEFPWRWNMTDAQSWVMHLFVTERKVPAMLAVLKQPVACVLVGEKKTAAQSAVMKKNKF